RTQQPTAHFFLCGQNAQASARAPADFGRIGAEEKRGTRRHLTIVHREVQREMMTLDTPAPVLRGWLPKNRKEVGLLVADGIPAFIEQDLVQQADVFGFFESLLAEANALQCLPYLDFLHRHVYLSIDFA